MEAIFSYYQLLTIILLGIWALIFIHKEEIRTELITLSIFSLFTIPIIFLAGRLSPKLLFNFFSILTITDFLFIFSLSGIAGTIFHIAFDKHYKRLPILRFSFKKRTEKIGEMWIITLFILFVISIWSTILLTTLFNIYAPISFLITTILITLYIISHRHDLLLNAFLSAILTATTTFIVSTIASIAFTVNIIITPVYIDNLFLGVPIDLILWSFSLGLFLGPIYEFSRKIKIK